MLDVMLVTPKVLVNGERLGEMDKRRLSAMMLRLKDFADKIGGGDHHLSLGGGTLTASKQEVSQMLHKNGMGFSNGVLRN